jgi:hypothetical protein
MVGIGTLLRVLPMAASGPWAEKVNRLALLIGSKCPQPKPPRRM